MESDVKLSVALVTRNRPESLERALVSLRAQTVQPFEVIVSDDSWKEHAEESQAVAATYGYTYRVGPHRGLYANRNFAAEQCRGSHIRTMDDDHVLPPDHLVQCLEAVSSDPNAIWTTGEMGYRQGKMITTTEVANQLAPSGVGERIENPDDNWGIADGSTIYPRAVFGRGFRLIEEFGHGSSYLEFGALLYANGWRSRCVPGAKIEHHATVIAQINPVSVLFASICFNRHFRPDIFRLGRHLLPHWRHFLALPTLFEKARQRWHAGNSL
jgi:glycosyltransferase involved in cell wall biosynthesis